MTMRSRFKQDSTNILDNSTKVHSKSLITIDTYFILYSFGKNGDFLIAPGGIPIRWIFPHVYRGDSLPFPACGTPTLFFPP